jgi:hypothetical protein
MISSYSPSWTIFPFHEAYSWFLDERRTRLYTLEVLGQSAIDCVVPKYGSHCILHWILFQMFSKCHGHFNIWANTTFLHKCMLFRENIIILIKYEVLWKIETLFVFSRECCNIINFTTVNMYFLLIRRWIKFKKRLKIPKG